MVSSRHARKSTIAILLPVPAASYDELIGASLGPPDQTSESLMGDLAKAADSVVSDELP
jgi:hypothetical protein